MWDQCRQLAVQLRMAKFARPAQRQPQLQFPCRHTGLIWAAALTALLLPLPDRLSAVVRARATAVPRPPAADTQPTPRNQTAQDQRQPITWEHVYGTQRISIGGGAPVRYTWISDSEYIHREPSGWKKVDARTNASTDWYDAARLAAALMTVEGMDAEEASQLSSGAWKFIQHERRLVVFERNGMLLRISLDGDQLAIIRDLPEGRELMSFSPTGSGVAFVKSHELWVADFESGEVRQLTHDATANGDIRNGKADWVYFEEVYNRHWSAFRWSPDGRQLLFQQFDDRHVTQFQVTDHTHVQPVVETERFPRAGEPNPRVRLGIVSLDGDEVTWLDHAAWPADDLIIAHFDWLPDSRSVYWYAQNRIQTSLEVVQSSAADGSSRRLLRDQTGAWVDNPGGLTFLRDGRFLFFSERTGWKHLYLVSADGSQLEPVTHGDWEVRSLLAVSADESFALVAGTRDSPIAENIYRISLQPAAPDITRLTPEDGHHTADVSRHGGLLVDNWSSLQQPTSSVLRDAQGQLVRPLREPAALPLDKYRFGKVELRQLPMADGTTTAAICVYPPDFDPGRRHPVWLMTYGGPHYPNVRNAFSSRLPEHLLASQGIVVIRFDPRTASGYGARSAWLAYKQLGTEETRDLVSVCDWLAQQPWADARRIGMQGHSYGGYFTAYAMTHCDRLCAGIAGAPVTDWANYDTIYTERFMSTPQDNPDGYRRSSVVRAAGDLQGRLLLLHGLLDDNVHPENSIQLMHQLQRHNRQFDVMFYPTARHGLSGTHYDKLLYNFIMKSLGKPEACRP